MSLNTAHTHGGVLIYNGEIILLYCDGVEFTIEGNHAKDFAGTRKGRIYLTTHRMIFINKTEKDSLQSFSFPFFSLSGVELEQPMFGANYIKGIVHAQSGGNWVGKATFKVKFFNGGAIEFGQAMIRAAKMASQNMPPQPPAYTPHQGPYFPAHPPEYMPPAGGVNGFIPPTHVFPDAPPPNTVYTSDMPPPYPGIYPPPYAFPPGSQGYPQAGAHDLVHYPGGVPPPAGFVPPPGPCPPLYHEETEPNFTPETLAHFNGVNQQATPGGYKPGAPPIYDFYQDPYNPHMMYAQQHVNGRPYNPQGPPPPYSDGSKKSQ